MEEGVKDALLARLNGDDDRLLAILAMMADDDSDKADFGLETVEFVYPVTAAG